MSEANDHANNGISTYEMSKFVKESPTGPPFSQTSNSITLKLEDQDVAFILGKHGVTKSKLQLVTDCRFEVDEKKNFVTIIGSIENRRRAHEYVDMVLAQRRGAPVQLDLTQQRSDMTIIQVPTECVGYATGTNGKVLRSLELEWETLMFFISNPNETDGPKTEILVIFGRRRGRIGSALKVMSAVEHKKQGFYVHGDTFIGRFDNELDADPNGFCMEQMIFQESDFSYALGKEGKTRKKLAKASGCILEYIGFVAVMVGSLEERQRVKDYLHWLLLQRIGECDVDVSRRNDVTVVPVEAKYVGWVTGVQGKNFRKIEEESGCYLFTNRSSGTKLNGEEVENILVFSHNRYNREKAERAIRRSISDKRDADTNGFRNSRRHDGDGRRGGGGGGDRRGRSRSPAATHRRGNGRRRSESPHRRREDSPSRRRSNSPRRREESSRRRDDSPRGRRREEDRGGRARGRSGRDAESYPRHVSINNS